MSEGRQVSHVAGSRRTTAEVIRELWATRKILGVLIRRDLKLRYAGSILGWVWTILEPLLMSGIYWFMFAVLIKRQTGFDPYIIFLLAGLLPWFWFNNGLTQGADALVSQRRLIASTALPRQIWVLRSVGAKGCEFLLSTPIFLIFLMIYRPHVDIELLYIPLGLVVEVLLLTGLGLLLSPIMVLVRDLKPIIRLATRFLFYASPIIYSTSLVSEASLPRPLKVIYELNPVAGIMECFRAGFNPDPARWHTIVVAAGVAVVTFAIGWRVFSRLESRVLKEI